MVLKNIEEKISIPKGVEIEINKSIIKIKGPKGENQRKLFCPKIKLSKTHEHIIIEAKKTTKKEKKIVNTFKSHIKNLINGVTDKFNYKIKICSGHFPINASIENNYIVLKNFFGEKKPRRAKILEGVDAKINGDTITLEGIDKEKVGQSASNIEQCTRRCKFDRRIYQDGCWIIEKDGKKVR
ncbi:MAG: 50S ribosomal protein L6 [Nanoarchaeota archaeon]|nr:50S ribosomal protein L6 [Nanoarchaeota archaeon]